ncbi:hypothetical protein V7799_29775 [Rhizobium laguerreae]
MAHASLSLQSNMASTDRFAAIVYAVRKKGLQLPGKKAAGAVGQFRAIRCRGRQPLAISKDWSEPATDFDAAEALPMGSAVDVDSTPNSSWVF